ncbi:MAG TPA: type II toxin-antitoxin system death-on-curing family toxin [Bryobacteraceae bacterium]|jgi:death-on-curing protein|nr:type II toxin-antitoxin system death-on-curing family toxin [Bryobacteraceae bacterium]
MTVEHRWISKKALLLLHEESLAEFGGARGLRDEGLLDSALARPQNTRAYNAESTVADLAASYGFGLAKNHPFVDGNKRAAFLSIGLFLAINGYQLKPDQVDAIQTMLAVANGELDEQGLSAWITKNSISMRRPPKKKTTRRTRHRKH